MLFTTKNLLSKASLLSGSLAIALLTTACNQKPTATDDTVADSKADIAVVDKSALAANEKPLIMTTLGLDSINNMILNPLIAGDTLNAEQKTCLQSRDKDLGQAQLQAYYKDKFSEAELKQLTDFYETSVGQKMLEYGRQEVVLMNGGEVATPMPAPTAEEISEIQTFMLSPTGTKYTQINNQIGEGSAIAALDEPFNAEFKRCTIDLTMAQIMQPAPAAPAPAG